VTVENSDSGPSGFTLVSVTTNEGSIASESNDWTLGTPDTSGYLQAARSGAGNGRVYTLLYRGFDRAENHADCAVTVTVPHDNSG
jgi:hypothetical protein